MSFSNSNSYIITSISTGVRQRTFTEGAVVAPFSLAINGAGSLRNTCAPYLPTDGGIPPEVTRQNCIFEPDPKLIDYTEIIDVTVIGTTSTHVGSIYLEAGTLEEIGFLICTSDISISQHSQIKRFSNDALLTDFDAGLGKCGYSYNSSVTVPASDWYDIYLSGSTSGTTSSIEGIYIKYPE